MNNIVPNETLDFISDQFYGSFTCALETLEDMTDVLAIAQKMAKDAIEGPISDRAIALHKIERLIKLCKWHGDDTWHFAAGVTDAFKEKHKEVIDSVWRANHVKE